METKRHSFLARAAMTLLLTVFTTLTTWADTWPAYITDVVLAGGTETEAQSVKNSTAYSGYTWCSTSLNDGTSGDVIYIGYKKSSSPAYINGGYITDFIIIDAGTGTEGHNPPYSLTFQGRTYYRCPAAGGDYFVNSNHGNLTSQAANGWNMYLYYTKANFSDKRAVDGISIYSVGDINDHKSGAINCYYKNGTLHEKEISLNKGVSNTPYVYMHINTVTKTNRPSTDPVMASGLVYNGSEQMLVASMGTTYDNTYKMWFREIGQNQYFYENTAQFTKATNAGTYNVEYYAGSSTYGDKSETKIHQVTIAKSPNNGLTVSCSNYLEGTAPVPSLVGNNLSTGTITYKYSTSQNGTYTTTVPSEPGTHWVKATIAGDGNCYDYTTAPVSFTITYNWKLHNSGDTEDDAYVISTTTDLKYLAVWVNLGNNFEGKFFKLGDNIAFDKSKENNFTPIGNSTYSFTGTFDGQGHTISGLNINKPDKDNVGLFGNTEEATIKNLIVDNSTINGKMSTGAIVGHSGNFVTVTNCRVTNSVTVSGTSQVGGITGVSSTVSGCVSAAAVSGSSFVGGIIGNGNFSSIANNLYTGTSINCPDIYKGAIVGEINGYTTLTANYYTADLSYKATANNNDINGACRAVVINTVDGVTVTPTGDATVYNVSGITGYDGNNVIGYDGHFFAGATESVSLDITYPIESFSVTGYNDGNGNALTHVSDNNYTLTMTADAPTVTPVGSDLWGVVLSSRDGSAERPYLITEPAGLDLLAKKVNGTDGYSANTFAGTYFELGDNITYDGTENNYTPIGGNGNHEFAGHFDGKGYTVSGININKNQESYKGLFGKIGSSAEVKNLTLDNTQIVGRDYCGGIAGNIYMGTTSNCHVTSRVTIHGFYSYSRYHGGIVGNNNTSSVIGCTSAATVSCQSSNSNMDEYGGIAGRNTSGTIQNCLVYGCSINGTSKVGAVVGNYGSGTLTNNHYSGVTLNGSEAHLNAGVGSGGQDGIGYICAIIPYEGVTLSIPSGSATTEYPYNGLKIYPTGMSYKGQYYNYYYNTDAGISGDVTFTATYSGDVPEGYVFEGFGYTNETGATNVPMNWAATDGSATCTLNTSIAQNYYITPTFTKDPTYLFVNMPTTGTKTVAIPAGVTSVKVYDDGGASGNYSYNCDGILVLTAPEGYLLQLSGNIMSERYYDKLTVYDGSDNTGTKLLDGVSSSSSGTKTAIPTVTSTGQSMTLYFYSDNSTNYAGLDLTVTLINLNTEFVITVNTATGGSVSSDKETAKPFETVTLTASPTEDYLLSDISVVDANSHAVDVEWTVWSNTATFTMPAAAVTVTLTFTDNLTSLSINIPKTGTRTTAIPAGVTSFKVYDDGGASGNYSDNCDGILVLTAPEGYVLQLSGNITMDRFDNLTVYDGSDNTGTRLLDGVSSPSSGTETAIPTVVSTGNSMTLYFYSDYNSNFAGLDLTVTLLKTLELANDADNADAISEKNGQTITALTLAGRTLYKDGDWNTLCLPFALTSAEIAASPLAGATIKELDGTSSNLDGSTLTLNFTTAYDPTDAPTGSIVAGKPYIVKWNPGAGPYFISGAIYDDGNSVIAGEGPEKLVDGDTGTKYFMNANPWVEFHYASAITPKGYALWTADDAADGSRNPTSWTIKAKVNSGDTWTTLVTVDNSAGDKLPKAINTRTVFVLDNSTAYKYFRFEAVQNSNGFQLAELQFYTDQPINITNPVFNNVTIDATASTEVTFTGGKFVGTYSPFATTDGLLLDAHNTDNGAFHAALSATTSDGNVLEGWYTDAGKTTPATTIPFTADGSATLYVKWAGDVPSLPGDANGDGSVTITDAVAIVNYILGKPLPAGFNEVAADMNGDGRVTISDAVAVVNMVASQQ